MDVPVHTTKFLQYFLPLQVCLPVCARVYLRLVAACHTACLQSLPFNFTTLRTIVSSCSKDVLRPSFPAPTPSKASPVERGVPEGLDQQPPAKTVRWMPVALRRALAFFAEGYHGRALLVLRPCTRSPRSEFPLTHRCVRFEQLKPPVESAPQKPRSLQCR